MEFRGRYSVRLEERAHGTARKDSGVALERGAVGGTLQRIRQNVQDIDYCRRTIDEILRMSIAIWPDQNCRAAAAPNREERFLVGGIAAEEHRHQALVL